MGEEGSMGIVKESKVMGKEEVEGIEGVEMNWCSFHMDSIFISKVESINHSFSIAYGLEDHFDLNSG